MLNSSLGYFLNFSLIFAHLGFLGLGSWIVILQLGISVDGVWGLWCRAFWVIGGWALYINIEEQKWEKNLGDFERIFVCCTVIFDCHENSKEMFSVKLSFISTIPTIRTVYSTFVLIPYSHNACLFIQVVFWISWPFHRFELP